MIHSLSPETDDADFITSLELDGISANDVLPPPVISSYNFTKKRSVVTLTFDNLFPEVEYVLKVKGSADVKDLYNQALQVRQWCIQG